jgi:hypothetical protein
MATETFSCEQFETQLKSTMINLTGSSDFEHRGLVASEYRYHLFVTGNTRWGRIIIEVASSIDSSGMAEPSGKNSIRLWLSDGNGMPLGSKISRWVTRVSGWEKRMDDQIKRLFAMGKSLKWCNKCNSLDHVFIVKKDGPNKGRLFKHCKCEGDFHWLSDEREQEEPTKTVVEGLNHKPLANGNMLKDAFKKVQEQKASEPEKKVFTPSKYQQAIFDWIQADKGKHLVVEALAGSGKCLGKGTPVLMFDGSVKQVEEIGIGDLLMGDDSNSRIVMSTSIGDGDLFCITPIKGNSWICNDVHILTLVNSVTGRIFDMPLNEYQEAVNSNSHKTGGRTIDRGRCTEEIANAKLFRTSVEFKECETEIPPYLMGIWLGDGTFDSPAITTQDKEIIDYCKFIAPKYGASVVIRPEHNHFNIRFRMGIRGVGNSSTPHLIWRALQKAKQDNEKRIPKQYLYNDRQKRLDLLAGLVDTDGYVGSKCIEIISKYENLANDIVYLARSIGFAAYMRSTVKGIKSTGFSGLYYRVSINGNLDIIPCLLPRKQVSQRLQKKNVLRTGFSIEYVGKGEYYGFTIDGNGRFLLGDFTVTHNTTTGVEALKLIPETQSVVFVAFNKHIAVELQKRLVDQPHIKVSTYHSLGYAAVRQAFGNVQMDEDKVTHILETIMDRYMYKPLFPIIRQMVSLVKANLTSAEPEDLNELATHYGIELNGDSEKIFTAVKLTVAKSKAMTTVIDYDDMCWLPVELNLKCKQYDFLFVDECLPYKTPILLADGTSEFIGDIVEKQLPVKVLSFDIESGRQVPCNVKAFHKILNQKELVKVRVKWSKNRSKTNSAYSFITCTYDHKIYTTRGYIEAGSLCPGMIVQVETSAKRSDNYKITSSGRTKLSGLMTDKNKTGVTGGYIPPKGIWNVSKGGNGRGLTEPQKLLLEKLGYDWIAEYPIKTKDVGGRKAGYPTCYKVDLANLSIMAAIEIDGSSHDTITDAKKDDCLQKLGWTVVRIKNIDVMQRMDEVISMITGDCPIDAEVVSIEPVHLKDWYVYDISVEHCHNFYANSILVHNCQDTNKNQIALAMKSIKPSGRIVAVGDRYQSLYGFRGADVDAVPNLIENLKAETLPLSITYRCPKVVVEMVNQKFPDIPLEAPEWAKEGEIRSITTNVADTEYTPGDMVLCRTNAPLVEPAFSLIRRGIKAIIRGRDIGKGLQALIRKMKAVDMNDLMFRLTEYRNIEVGKLLNSEKGSQAQSLQDKVDTIIALSDGINSITELEIRIEEIFSDENEGVVFSSVHRAKGLEAKRVYILHSELMPHPLSKKSWELQQEQNIIYVAYTRSLSELIFVGA